MTKEEAKEIFLNRGFINGLFDGDKWRQSIVVISEWLEQDTCEDWYDVPSDEMTLGQARQAVKDLRKKLAEYFEQELCTDAINRQAAIDTIESWLSCDDYNKAERHIMRATQSMLYDLPPVTPQPKTGHWIKKEDDTCWWYVCSECEQKPLKNRWNDDDDLSTFCPNCGAKMGVEK